MKHITIEVNLVFVHTETSINVTIVEKLLLQATPIAKPLVVKILSFKQKARTIATTAKIITNHPSPA